MRVSVSLANPSGIAADAPDLVLPDAVFTDGRNFRFRDEAAENMGGYARVFGSLSAVPIFVGNYSDPLATYWLYGSATVCYATDGTTHANINNAAGNFSASADLGYTGGPFHGYYLLNDGQGIPQTWKPGLANVCTTLSAWPTTIAAKIVRPHKDFVFAADITSGGTRNPRLIRWSDAAPQGGLPASFDYTDPTNQSGITELGQTDDGIVDMMSLRDGLIVYKQYRTWRADLIDSPDAFDFREVFTESGLLTRNCVVSLEAQHVALTDSDVVRHDGNQAQSIIGRRMRRWLFNRIDTTAYKRSFVVKDPVNREVLVCFPESGASWPTLALVWNWQDDSLAVRDLGGQKSAGQSGIVTGGFSTIDAKTAVIASYTDPYDYTPANPMQRSVILTDYAKASAYQLDNGYTFDGVAMSAYLERTGLTVSQDFGVRKRVLRVYPKVIGTMGDTLSIYVGAANAPGQGAVYDGPFTYTIGVDSKIDCRTAGRILALKFAFSGSNRMRLYGYDLDVEEDGRR